MAKEAQVEKHERKSSLANTKHARGTGFASQSFPSQDVPQSVCLILMQRDWAQSPVSYDSGVQILRTKHSTTLTAFHSLEIAQSRRQVESKRN